MPGVCPVYAIGVFRFMTSRKVIIQITGYIDQQR